MGNLTLSVLVREDSSTFVQHCHVNYDAASKEYYIRSDERLESLDKLINFYRGEWMGLHHDVKGQGVVEMASRGRLSFCIMVPHLMSV